MKIIQTLWTLPGLTGNNEKNILQNRLHGGWLQPKYYYFSMAYSCLTLRKFYNSVELITDDFGEDLLINKLQLPYTSVKKLPEKFNAIPIGLWALPKIYSYSIQNEPFIHVDNDIFIWDKLNIPKNTELLVQNFERLTSDYDIAIDHILKNFVQIPEFIYSLDKYQYQSVNAGVFGGNDIEFFKMYTQKVFEFIEINMKYINPIYSGVLNVVFEQLFFYQLSKLEHKNITTLFEQDLFDNIANLIRFEEVPFGCKYIHCLGELKKHRNLCEQIEFRLCNEYPETYNRILELLKIKSVENNSKYLQFIKSNNIFAHCLSIEDVLDIPLTLSDNIQIEKQKNRFYLVENRKKTLLKHWNKFLIYFYNNYITGRKLCNEIMKTDLKNQFSYTELKENIAAIITQHTILLHRLKQK